MVASRTLKQRLLPLFAFLSAFTVVMTILIFSTDIRGRRYHRVPLNMSVITDFQNAVQDDPQLISYIRKHHLKPPPTNTSLFKLSEPKPDRPEFADIFEWKKNGIFVETGAYRHGGNSTTYWLERMLGWHGLLTQPDPHDYKVLQEHASFRMNSYTANVCLSPTSNPKQVSFRPSSTKNDSYNPTTLTKVQCFPLYSLLLAYNATKIDFLSLNAEKAEFQVLRTVPFQRVSIGVIGIAISSENGLENESELIRLTKLLSPYHYKLDENYTTKNQYFFVCSRGLNGCSAPRISI